MTPFDIWMTAWRNGAAMLDAGWKLGEMTAAAGAVVQKRCGMIGDACRDPLNGDYRELGRMAPEKFEAFSRASAAMVDDWRIMQADTMANWQAMTRIAMTGRPASPTEVSTVMKRSSRVIERAIAAPGRAMAPVHKRATGNARRLRTG